MARSRNIKPGFYKNEELAECSVWARLIFPGLWMLADREGRLEDRPKRIKAELLPMDAQEVEPLLVELADHGFIKRYKADGKAVIWIPNFLKHQNPHHREQPSDLPSHESPGLCVDGMQEKPEASTPFHGGQAVLIPDSPLSESLNSDSLNTATPDKSGERFGKFWLAYPKKVAKADAKKAFDKTKADDALLARMLNALEQWKRHPDWIKEGGQYVPNPATWLNGGRWDDEFPATVTDADDWTRTAA